MLKSSYTRLPKRLYHNSSRSPYTGPAFCFDIDGVLKQGEKVLPEAKEALQILSGKNSSGKKFPFILCTNGGGTMESARALKLSKELGVTIGEHQVIQNHTLYRVLAEEFANQPVLVIGGHNDKCRKIAESYGFKNVYIPADVLNWFPSIWPFDKLTPLEKTYIKEGIDFSTIQFAAVFIFHDSLDWGRDITLALDLVRADKGVFGTFNSDPSQPQIPVFFSAADLLWGNDFPQVRLGQGAFQVAMTSVYKAMSGTELKSNVSGKPSGATYDYASNRLKMLVDPGCSPSSKITSPVYMVGDNPASDIAGANNYHDNWQSILVRTGVFRGKINDERNPANFVAKDVLEGVLWALEKEKQII